MSDLPRMRQSDHTKESGRLSKTAEWHSVAYLRQAYLDMKVERDALREEVENWRNGMIEQSVKRHVAKQKARPDMRQSDPTKQSGEVQGTVPSQWYLDMKAERDALREAINLYIVTVHNAEDHPNALASCRCPPCAVFREALERHP